MPKYLQWKNLLPLIPKPGTQLLSPEADSLPRPAYVEMNRQYTA